MLYKDFQIGNIMKDGRKGRLHMVKFPGEGRWGIA